MSVPSPLKLEISDATDRTAFITGADPEHGYDVAMLVRYDARNCGTDEHLRHALSDDQWQKLVTIVHAALEQATI